MTRMQVSVISVWLMAAMLCCMVAGCHSTATPPATPVKFSPTGGASPQVEEANLINAVKNNGHIPEKMKPKIIQSIKARFKFIESDNAKQKRAAHGSPPVNHNGQ